MEKGYDLNTSMFFKIVKLILKLKIVVVLQNKQQQKIKKKKKVCFPFKYFKIEAPNILQRWAMEVM